MTILVTGATGLLGNNIVRDLLASGEQVRIITREKKSSEKALAGLAVERFTGDVRDPDAVDRAMANIATVIHCAGHVHIGWSQADLHQAINVQGTDNVARSAQKVQAKMIHVSSVNAIGVGGPHLVVDEETALSDVVPCPYVTTKIQAEKNILERVAQGLHAVIVNPAFMLGPWDWRPSSGRMLLAVSKAPSPLAPVGSFSVCDVRDVSAGTIAAITQGTVGRRYILGGHNISYIELWRKMAHFTGKLGPLLRAGPVNRTLGGWAGDAWYRLTGHEPDLNSAGVLMSSQYHVFSSERAERELGYHIRPLQETLRAAWDWFIEYGYIK